MEYETQVEQFFHHSISAKIDCVETVTPAVVRASIVLADCFLAENKMLVCGNGGASLNAQFFAMTLMNQGERERPGLPAIMLDNNSAAVSAMEEDYGVGDGFARQIRAIGQPGDCLVLFTSTGTSASLRNAVVAAHERDMVVIALTAQEGGHLPALLAERDIEIRVPLVSRFRIHENHLLLSFALCELIESHMFGGL
jgi:D-sedoheptulose 7-phosphate isomerase